MQIKTVKIISVIETKTKVGNGTEEDPNRFLFQYWSLHGALLATRDEHDLSISDPSFLTQR